jgi:TPR repeat protein
VLLKTDGGAGPVMEGKFAMACIDVDALTQYEADAKQGRPDALYNLGLAYSTGQGVIVDFVAAHKWFNLAALRGSDEAKTWRAQISREMNTSQIAEAQRLAREWLSIFR